jgi:hypothetical protein
LEDGDPGNLDAALQFMPTTNEVVISFPNAEVASNFRHALDLILQPRSSLCDVSHGLGPGVLFRETVTRVGPDADWGTTR